MSIFISAGLLGFAAGPVYFSAVVTTLGLERMLWAAIPGVLFTVLLYFRLRGPGAVVARSGSRFEWRALAPVWRPLAILYFLVFIRSVVQVTFNQFLPLYLHRERGLTIQHASWALAVFLAAGAIGGFLGGNFADAIGGRRVILLSMLGAVPFLLGFFLLPGAWSILSLAAGGLMLVLTNPVNIVMAQELAPGHSGTVSALMMGFAWGTAGFISIPLTGWASDQLSLHQVLGALAATPLLGWALATRLPKAD
jgi:FSR family fosmidomycin resistance protein-like MFS transporter